jgi:hypothetical protein
MFVGESFSHFVDVMLARRAFVPARQRWKAPDPRVAKSLLAVAGTPRGPIGGVRLFANRILRGAPRG